MWNEYVCTENWLNVEYGILQEKIVTNFQDYFLTTMNEKCPVDSTKDKRDPTTLFNYSTANTLHPCSLDPKSFFNINTGFNSERVHTELYQPAVNVVERHNCNGYCFRKNKKRKKQVQRSPPRVLNNMTVGIGRKKKEDENNVLGENNCRFDFPQPLNDNGTCMKIREYVSGSDGVEPQYTYELSMNSIRNDRWLNSHMYGLMQIWLANMDFQLVVDVNKVVSYMTKYVCKPEMEMTKGLSKMVQKIINVENHRGLGPKGIF